MSTTVARMAVMVFLLGSTRVAVAASPPDAEAVRRWAVAHPVVRVAIDAQQGSEITGESVNPLVSDYLSLTARKAGIRLQPVRTASWDASVKAFLDGQVDLLPSTNDAMLKDVDGRALLSAPFYEGRTLIIARTVGPSALTMRDLDGMKVAYKGGGAYDAWLARAHPGVRRLPLADLHQVLVAVESGIADVAIGADVSFGPILRRDYAASLRVAGDVPELPVTVRVAARPDAPELIALIEKALRSVGPKESERIIEHWLQLAYLRPPTLSQVLASYGVEIGLAIALVIVLLFAMVQLRRAQLASRRSERQKTLLLAVMSHEVRNAVNAVTSSVDLLAREPGQGAQRDLLAIAVSSSRNLQSLLKSALDFSRGEAAGFIPDLAPCDAYGVLRDVLESHRLTLDARGVEARLDLPMGPLPWLLLDETRVRQVIDNLVGNAVKFTARGHVGLSVWQSADESSTDEVRHLFVEVSDTGEGIPPERQKAIFQPFAQAHGERSRRLGGTGLGLPICREIVRQLGGTLELTSGEGAGTTVRVVLPTSLVPPPPELAVEPPDTADAPVGVVLLVEDHPANRQILAAQLRYIGFDTVAVDRGQAAIDVFEPGRFDAVLLDCELPDMHGYDVAMELRAQESAMHGVRTRFVAISATTGDYHVQRCEQAGVDVVLGKPLVLASLREALARPEVMASARVAFRKESLADLHRLRDALATSDTADARAIAHRMRGSALVFGAYGLAGELSRLEHALQGRAADGATLDELLEQVAVRL
ncbi:ATP-binding protein [Luteibacter sp. PPL552]